MSLRWTAAELDRLRAKISGTRENMEFVDLGIGTLRVEKQKGEPPKSAARARAKKDMLLLLFDAWGFPAPFTEYRFHPGRKWRFDYAWLHRKLAIEIEGGLFTAGGGRHNRGAGMRDDMEKYNEATLLGWRVLRFLPEQKIEMMRALRLEFAK